MMGPNPVPAHVIWKETGISQTTLSRWKEEAATISIVPSKRAPKRGAAERTAAPAADRASAKTTPSKRNRTGPEKLAIVVRAEGLEGEALGAFLRREGVHFAELERWRKQAAEALSETPRLAPSTELRNLRADLARKEKALAEMAALVILKKKVVELWGDEDDDTEPTSG
jgi:hypothetical protein